MLHFRSDEEDPVEGFSEPRSVSGTKPNLDGLLHDINHAELFRVTVMLVCGDITRQLLRTAQLGGNRGQIYTVHCRMNAGAKTWVCSEGSRLIRASDS